jgi:hypothetical protein
MNTRQARFFPVLNREVERYECRLSLSFITSGLHVTRKAERNEVAFFPAMTRTPSSARRIFSTFPGALLPPYIHPPSAMRRLA